MMLRRFLFSIFALQMGSTQKLFRILMLTEENQDHNLEKISTVLKTAEGKYPGFVFEHAHVAVMKTNEGFSFDQLCQEMTVGVSMVLDLTWTGWTAAKVAASTSQLPYFRADTSMNFFAPVQAYLAGRNTSDVAFIFHDDQDVDKSLLYLFEKSTLRFILLNGLGNDTVKKLLDMRPAPRYFVMCGSTTHLAALYEKVVETKLGVIFEQLLLVFEDFNYQGFNRSLQTTTVVITPKMDVCCGMTGISTGCECENKIQPVEVLLHQAALFVSRLAAHLDQVAVNVSPRHTEDCAAPAEDPEYRDAFYANVALVLETMGNKSLLCFEPGEDLLHLRDNFDLWMVRDNNWTHWAQYKDDQLVLTPGATSQPVRRFFKVGIVENLPWSFRKRDGVTGEFLMDEQGRPEWDGYCVDMLLELAARMQFDYEVVVPESGGLGARQTDGTWDGLVGDLAAGKTDIIIAPLSVTSEREEVIDFVTPHFDKSGISIVIRKPVFKTSLFKFMTVLKLEVWFSILISLTATAVMIWLLDKYSPYSYQNNKKSYSHPCRDFTLTESFWFAITSITPQGGGEVPQALSGRTLVASYWIFVMLTLATFTANLAAFLTVERMEMPVSSLEQLGRQSRISYTVVRNSETHEYFRNMKNAEEILNNAWKNMALNASNDPSQYRVWDYPIKEQYENILLAITETGPVENETVGFQKVLGEEDSKFAFIHDSVRIRYEVTRSCYLTEVGDVFAEREYAIAVQQGSHLFNEISMRLMELKKNLYFEGLAEKYWNPPKKLSCSNSDQSDGITLESLGGIFIATVFGLILAMIILGGEVFYHHKRGKNRIKPLRPTYRNISVINDNFHGRDLWNVPKLDSDDVSYISVFPRGHLY